MSPPLPQGQTPQEAEAEHQAHIRVNQTVIKSLAARVQSNPSLDLSPFLTHHTQTYAETRKLLSESAKRQASDATSTVPAPTQAPDIRIQLQVTEDVRVVHPLHDVVLRLLDEGTTQEPATLSAAAIAALNQLLAQSTVLWQLGSAAVLSLTPQIVVKIGGSIDTSHIPTLQHITLHAPSIPVPAIYGLLAFRNLSYVFMSRIPGQSLDELWPTLTEQQKSSIQSQLIPLFSSLRSVPEPPGGPALGGGEPRRCKDVRRYDRVASTPITTEAEFNDFLLSGRRGIRVDMVRSFLREDHKMVMTHGDLHPRNIMATLEEARDIQDGDAEDVKSLGVKIEGIIDWEYCGWYPEYWEYVKALNTIAPGDEMQDWWAYLPTAAIGTWPAEFAIDLMVSRLVG
ncbi:hypothetical protein RUND412_004726 [Rhizina undulata]